MKHLIAVMFAATFAISFAASAEDGPGTIPDGPVEGPPGWVCTAKAGVVTCEARDQEGPAQ
ncbi:MAG: hypothetical protein K0M70_02670 [Arenimonas sp.]|uniref:hypothetical protein n=1 Tax=Arenimonas sp. TaxID=1872635 RepID=UPI0025C24240|nr:hypothetical protein [Arenimonas sp.]MBW8366744.1 hypothetical protein [Arenimonas sp.]